MQTHTLLVLGICAATLSSASGGIIAQPELKSLRKAESSDSASQPSHDAMESEKVLLGRLVTELQESGRSFIYLRSIGFKESDEEFERIIAANNKVFRSIRIVRRDEHGNRVIPGWPGIALTPEYLGEKR
jgi:hypothetical protein